MLTQFKASQLSVPQDPISLSNLLYKAILRSDTPAGLEFIEAGAQVNMHAGFDNFSLLMSAADNKLNEVCLKMIEKGAFVNWTDIDGQSALTIAAKQGLSDVCLELIKRGAKLNEYCNFSMRTPLWYAIENNMSEVCEKLREAGAEEFPRSRFTHEPLEIKAHKRFRI